MPQFIGRDGAHNRSPAQTSGGRREQRHLRSSRRPGKHRAGEGVAVDRGLLVGVSVALRGPGGGEHLRSRSHREKPRVVPGIGRGEGRRAKLGASASRCENARLREQAGVRGSSPAAAALVVADDVAVVALGGFSGAGCAGSISQRAKELQQAFVVNNTGDQ